MSKSRCSWGLVCAFALYAGTIAPAVAQPAAKEAGPGASPKVVACMTACEQTQMTCLQGAIQALQTPVERRTIKDINQARACNRAEERCDHQCRRSK
jgi:hypothetical protein